MRRIESVFHGWQRLLMKKDQGKKLMDLIGRIDEKVDLAFGF